MTIFGIEGGIGTGKTLTLVTLGLEDLFKGKKLYSNVTFKSLRRYSNNIIYMDKERMNSIFELVKVGQFDMKNSTVLIQEAHNYVDSRNSQTKRNKLFTYWILQSRHTGAGSCDIIFDTQELGQVDLRLRRNTDFVIRPSIVEWDEKRMKTGKIERIPATIFLDIRGKVGHRMRRMSKMIDVRESRNKYDTHELVEF